MAAGSILNEANEPPPPVFSESHRYRASNRGYFIMSGLIASLGVLSWVLGSRISVVGSFYATLAGAALVTYAISVALMMMAANHFYWVYVMSDGLRSYDGLGIYHDVRWEDMKGTYQLKLFPGVTYTCIRHTGGFAIAIPRFLQEFGAFRANVIRLAPPDNLYRQRVESQL